MKKIICIICMCALAISCGNKSKDEARFQSYLDKIPEMTLPFTANSHNDLNSKVEINDPVFKDFYADAQGIIGKININDSIAGIVYVYAGDIVAPQLKTYDKKGRLISEQMLVNLPGGSDGYSSNGSSYMSLDKDFHISITDTIRSFERDSAGVIKDSTRQVKVVNYKYAINANGKIETREIIQRAVSPE